LFLDLCSKNSQLDWRLFLDETMRRPGFLIVGLIVFGSVALGLAALAGNISLRERNISALRADARTSNDNVANASLPGSALSTDIVSSSGNGRSVGLNTPPAMFANGTVGNGIWYLNNNVFVAAAYGPTLPPGWSVLGQ
jgi:hypothetical protein